MVRRGAAGCFIYLLIWIIIVGIGDLLKLQPDIAWSGIILLSLFSILRTWLSVDYQPGGRSEPKIQRIYQYAKDEK